MPELDGLQLASLIKNDPTTKDTVLVLLTSSATMPPTDELQRLGFAGCMMKPLTQSGLLGAIVESLVCASSPSEAYDKPVNSATTASARTKGARLLLAEDNETGQEVALTVLRQAGYHCDAVENGQEAVEAVLDREYDLILMDCQMPVMDGFDATRAIRRHEKDGTLSRREKGRIPIVALTANAIKGDREQCLESGMDDYLTKPLDPDRLVEVIENHLTPGGGALDASPVGVSDEPMTKTEPTDENADRSPVDVRLPFDTDALLKRWGGNKAFAEKLIAMFRKQAPSDLEKLEQAVAAGDVEEATRFAHGLKGAASYVAADAFRAVAARLEEMGRTGGFADAEDGLSELRAELKRCLESVPNGLADVEPQHANTDR